MAADDEQALLAFLADLGEGDDPVDAADPDDAQEATDGPKEIKRRPSRSKFGGSRPAKKRCFFVDNKEPREHETVSRIRILRGLYFSFDIA